MEFAFAARSSLAGSRRLAWNDPASLVTREELRRCVWPRDTFVDFDHALNTAIKKIRAALNDDADALRYIETVLRRGYRLIATIEQEPAPASVPVPPIRKTHHRLHRPGKSAHAGGSSERPVATSVVGTMSSLATFVLFYLMTVFALSWGNVVSTALG